MMTLKKLHESFIQRSNRPMNFGALPVEPKEPVPPLVAVERWKVIDQKLFKKFIFMNLEQRNDFIRAMLEYESEVQHVATLSIDEDSVSITLITKDINEITSLDKEYAANADTMFKEVIRLNL